MRDHSSSGDKNHLEKGQSLVEFAITLTLIITLLAGVVDFGRAFFIYVELRDAAQEGALYGSMNPTDTSGIINRVKSASDTPVDLANDPNITVPNPIIVVNPCEGNSIEVQVQYTYQISMPYIGGIIGTQTIPLTASATDTILTPVCS